MKRWLALLLLLLLGGGLFAYDIVSPIGGRSGAMGRVTTCAQDSLGIAEQSGRIVTPRRL